MSDPLRPDESTAYNESSFQTLLRAIELSQGQFSLILVRCNYASLRKQMVRQLLARCPIQLRQIVLDESASTLYKTILTALGKEQPPALMVFGLESVRSISAMLVSTNQVREEFRKNFPFPLLLWVNDEILQKLIRLAPDFESWATTVEFALPTAQLSEFLRREADFAFAKALDAGAGRFTNSCDLDLAIDSPERGELQSAFNDLLSRGQALEPDIEASLKFILGRDAYLSGRMEEARQHYERSLAFWQQSHHLERQACLLFHLGAWWYSRAEVRRAEYLPAYRLARDYFSQCVAALQQAGRPGAAAKFINALGASLQRLQQWEDLETVAEIAVGLHQTCGDPIRSASAYGFLAEVALSKSAWMLALEYAQMALAIHAFNCQSACDSNTDLGWAQRHCHDWYLLLLAEAQKHLGEVQPALENLETARSGSNPQYDPQQYNRILELLRQLYFERGEYLSAFLLKQERLKIEQQYGFRAFIGAGRLQPSRQALNPALTPVEPPAAVAREIAASDRHKDVQRLIEERISRTDRKLTVIHGPDGVGKSSILRAGLVPALKQKTVRDRHALPVVQQVYTNWVRELGKSLKEALAEVQGVKMGDFPSAPESAHSAQAILDRLRKNADGNLLTVLIFDQFEEFFFACKKPAKRLEFYEFLRECLNIPFLKVILSLREDYLSYWLDLNRLPDREATDSNILYRETLYCLGNFSPAAAKSVLRLTEKTNYYLEPALIDKIVEDLAGDLGEVRPLELQVVGLQLEEEKISTLAQYRERGGKEKLVERFLQEAVKDCGAENERVARQVLYLLTGENSTRPLKTRAELAAGLQDLGLKASADQLDLALTILTGTGLVFLLPNIADRYQLAHESLVPLIRQQQEAVAVGKQKRQKKLSFGAESELNRVLGRRLQQAGLSLMGIVAALAGVLGWQAKLQTQRAEVKEIQQLNQASKALFLSGKQLEGLIASLRGGKPLLKIEAPPDIKTETADRLRQALSKIQERNRLQGHRGSVLDVSFSPAGDRPQGEGHRQVAPLLATAGGDGTVKLWNSDGHLLRTIKVGNDRVNRVSFSPDGQILASASDDATVKLWKRDGTFVRKLQHSKQVSAVSFSSQGQIIASGSKDKTVKLWRRDGTLQAVLNHGDWVYDVSFSPDGQTIASAGRDKTVKLWSRDGKLLKTLKGHNKSVWGVSFSPDGKTIASASEDKTVKLWNLDGQLLSTLQGHSSKVKSVSFSPSGQIIASASSDSTIRLWSLDGSPLRIIKGHTSAVNKVSFSRAGTLASAGDDATVRLWGFNKQDPLFKILSGHSKSVSGVGVAHQKVQRQEDSLLRTLEGRRDTVSNVRFSRSGQLIASASYDRTLKLKEPHRQVPDRIEAYSAWGSGLSFIPEDRTLASAGADKTVKLWSLNSGELNLELYNLVGRSCDWRRDYLKNNPRLKNSDRHLCDGTGSQK
jgi:WD40 repeat protein